MSAQVYCDQCGEQITGDPAQDPVAVSWLGAGAPKFCSVWCLIVSERRAIDAEGGVA